MELDIYQIDAFASEIFKGNPAAVCPLQAWLPDALMQNIALENNLSETVFYVPTKDGFHIRWFTPFTEVKLCGHATLATAFLEFFVFNNPSETLKFHSQSGILTITRKGEIITLDFPSDSPKEIELSAEFNSLFNDKPIAAFKGKTDYMLVFKNETIIINLEPDLKAIAGLNARALMVTAKGDKVDFVSRFFAPQSGIDEDPVTGFAHTLMIPYWSKQLGKTKLTAKQLSKRGGDLACEFIGDRVKIGGKAVLYMKGKIHL